MLLSDQFTKLKMYLKLIIKVQEHFSKHKLVIWYNQSRFFKFIEVNTFDIQDHVESMT